MKFRLIYVTLCYFVLFNASCQSKEEKEKYQAALKESQFRVRIEAASLQNSLVGIGDLAVNVIGFSKQKNSAVNLNKESQIIQELKKKVNDLDATLFKSKNELGKIDLDHIDSIIAFESNSVKVLRDKVQSDPALLSDSSISELFLQIDQRASRVVKTRHTLESKIAAHNKNFPKDKL